MMPSALRVLAKAVVMPLLLGAVLVVIQRFDSYRDIRKLGFKLDEVARLEPETVFLGSSQTYHHVDPALFDSLHGGRSYNFGMPGAPGLESHFWAERFLERPYIRRLVIEIRPVAVLAEVVENRQNRRTYYYHDLRRAWIGMNVALASGLPWWTRWAAARTRAVGLLHHYTLIGQGERLFVGPSHGDEPLPSFDRQGHAALDGELARARQLRAERTGAERAKAEALIRSLQRRRKTRQIPKERAVFERNMAELQRRAEAVPDAIQEASAEVWVELYQRAAARGVEVYFVEQPGGGGETAGLSLLLGNALPPGRVIVLRDPLRYPQLLSEDYWFDIGHMSGKGARWETSVLAEQLPLLPNQPPR